MKNEPATKIAVWNLEWATVRQKRSAVIKQMLNDASPDVCCFTEAYLDNLPHQGEVISAVADYGYDNGEPQRRKVVLTSLKSWTEVDVIGHPNLPPGRFVSGITGGVRYLGVCIPWHDAHVSTGRRDASRWSEHRDYLAALKLVIQDAMNRTEPICLLGDYNQRVPKGWQPQDVYEQLLDSIAGLNLNTADVPGPDGKLLIDHVATSTSMDFKIRQYFPKENDGVRLSDHTGYCGELSQGCSSIE